LSEGPPSPGVNFFAGGENNASSSASQSINVSSGAAAIDAGTVHFTLSGWLGGYSSQGDNAQLTIEFLNESDSEVGSAVIGPVTASERDNATKLLSKSTTGRNPQHQSFVAYDACRWLL